MESNDKFEEISIKNRTRYYFSEIVKNEDFDFYNILLDKSSYENIFDYKILYKILISSKLLRINFEKVDGFIRVYDETKYSVLFGRSGKWIFKSNLNTLHPKKPSNK